MKKYSFVYAVQIKLHILLNLISGLVLFEIGKSKNFLKTAASHLIKNLF